MMSIIAGVVVTGAGVTGLWLAMPRNGEVRWFAKAKVLDWLIPTSIVTALALGVALVVSGAFG